MEKYVLINMHRIKCSLTVNYEKIHFFGRYIIQLGFNAFYFMVSL